MVIIWIYPFGFSSKSYFFVIVGERTKKGEKKGVIVGINFGDVYPLCRLPDSPDTEYSDFETWRPRGGEANECFLGHKISIVRRKRTSKCIQSEKFEPKIIQNNCDCTEDDYQCDVGYHRNEPGDPCTPIKKIDALITNAPPKVCDGYYNITRGYRKVAGDYCKGGEKFDPIKVACPYNIFSVIFKGLLYVIVILIVGGAFFLFCVNRQGDFTSMFSGFTDFIRYKLPENYLNIDNVDEDNTLFGNEDIREKRLDEDNKIEPKIKEEKKDSGYYTKSSSLGNNLASSLGNKNLASSISNVKKNSTNLASSLTNFVVKKKKENAEKKEETKPEDKRQSIKDMIAKSKQMANSHIKQETSPYGTLPVGTRVFHSYFGIGHIKSVEQEGMYPVYNVEFMKHGLKQVDVSTTELKTF